MAEAWHRTDVPSIVDMRGRIRTVTMILRLWDQ